LVDSLFSLAIATPLNYEQSMNPIQKILFLSLMVIPPFAQCRAEGWQVTSQKDGITVYKKDMPGTSLIALRGETVIEEGMPRIVGVLENVERAKEWMANIAESYNIEKKTETDRWEYNRTKTPWPLQDREFVIHTLTRLIKGPEPLLVIEMVSGENPKKPHTPGVVRGELIDSRFILKYIGARKTHLTCEILADPKGAIPKWVVNLFQSKWPVDTINGLKKQLQKQDIVENQNLARALLNP
jgi:hypothetical protein